MGLAIIPGITEEDFMQQIAKRAPRTVRHTRRSVAARSWA
jgi:hypothetical protein